MQFMSEFKANMAQDEEVVDFIEMIFLMKLLFFFKMLIYK